MTLYKGILMGVEKWTGWILRHEKSFHVGNSLCSGNEEIFFGKSFKDIEAVG